MTKTPHKRRHIWFYVLLAALILFFLLNFLLQTFFAHRTPLFVPTYNKSDITALCAADRSPADDQMLFRQTGLAPAAIDALLLQGEVGKARILEIQDAFFAVPQVDCQQLGLITKEERQVDENGSIAYGPPLAPLENGDVIVSFATHTYGWRHGHAGLVVDGAQGITLEAVVLGSDSAQMYAEHWRSYSNFMVLRVKDATAAERVQVASYALSHLDGIPYHLTSGIFGPKAADAGGALSAQCAYLPWYAWQASGYDLDSDGGRIVTVKDLAESPLLEVVQVYGMNPDTVLGRI